MNTSFSEFSGEEEAASEFEQQAWFEHQQQLHGEGQQLLAWQLTGAVDYGRLVNVLEQAQRQWPGMNARYVYGERGLMRSDNSCSPPAVTIQTIRHPIVIFQNKQYSSLLNYLLLMFPKMIHWIKLSQQMDKPYQSHYFHYLRQ